MPNPQINAALVKDRLSDIRAHCMCARFEDDGAHFICYYPPGFALDGARAAYVGASKAIAAQRLLDVMERHWQEAAL